MRALDIGCGAGDVSLLAAAFVGVRGGVLGIDLGETSVALARTGASGPGAWGAGLANARLARGRIDKRASGEASTGTPHPVGAIALGPAPIRRCIRAEGAIGAQPVAAGPETRRGPGRPSRK